MTLKQILKNSLEKYAEQPASVIPGANKGLGQNVAQSVSQGLKSLGGNKSVAPAGSPLRGVLQGPAPAGGSVIPNAGTGTNLGTAAQHFLSQPAQPGESAIPSVSSMFAQARGLQNTAAPTSTAGFNKPDAHYYLPPDEHGFAYGPRGGAPKYDASYVDWDKSPAHRTYMQQVRAQYPDLQQDPIEMVRSWRRPQRDPATNEVIRDPNGDPHYLTRDEQEKTWQEFVDAHPVAQNFTAPQQPGLFSDFSGRKHVAAINNAREQALQAELPTPTAPQQQAAPQMQPPAVSQPAAAQSPAPTQAPVSPAATTQTAAPNPAAASGTTQNPSPPAGQPTAEPKPLDQTTANLAQVKKEGTPEQQAAAEQETVSATVEHLAPTVNDETKKQVEGHLAGDQQATAEGRDRFVADQAGGDPNKTQDPNWYGQAMGMWDNMGPMGQAAFMIGVPAALIGLLSGDGLMGILGGLGIGALGMGAGAMGLMGDKTRAGMGKLMNNAYGFFTGQEVPQNLDAFGEKGQQETLAAVQQAMDAQGENGQRGGWAAGQKAIADRAAKADTLLGLPRDLAVTSLMGMGAKSPDEAHQLLDQIAAQRQEVSSPDFLRNKAREKALGELQSHPQYGELQKMFTGRAAYGNDTSKRTWEQWYRERQIQDHLQKDPRYRQFLGADGALPAGATPESFVDSMLQNAYGAYPGEKGASMNVAQHLSRKYLVTKAARCWAGYEPVPGAKAYSRGSCRPVGSKKTQKEMKSGKERHHETTKQGCAQG